MATEETAKNAIDKIKGEELPTSNNNLTQLKEISSYWGSDHDNIESLITKFNEYLKGKAGDLNTAQKVDLSSVSAVSDKTRDTALELSSKIMDKIQDMEKLCDNDKKVNFDKKYNEEWLTKWNKVFEKYRYTKKDFTGYPGSTKSKSSSYADENDLNGTNVRKARESIDKDVIPMLLARVARDLKVSGDLKSSEDDNSEDDNSILDGGEEMSNIFFGKFDKKGIGALSIDDLDELYVSLKIVASQKIGLFREDKDIMKKVKSRIDEILSLITVAKALKEEYEDDKEIFELAYPGTLKQADLKNEDNSAKPEKEHSKQRLQESIENPSDDYDDDDDGSEMDSEGESEQIDLKNQDIKSKKKIAEDSSTSDETYSDDSDDSNDEKAEIKNLSLNSNKDLYSEEKQPKILKKSVPIPVYNSIIQVIWLIKDMCIYYLDMVSALVKAGKIKLDGDYIKDPYILGMVRYCAILLRRADETIKNTDPPPDSGNSGAEDELGDNHDLNGTENRGFAGDDNGVEHKFGESKADLEEDFKDEQENGVELGFDDLPDDIDLMTDPWSMVRATLLTASCVVLKNFDHLEDFRDKDPALFDIVSHVLCNDILSGNESMEINSSNEGARKLMVTKLYEVLKEYLSGIQKHVQENQEQSFLDESSKNELLEKITKINNLVKNKAYFFDPENHYMRKIFEIMEDTGEENSKETFLGQPYINGKEKHAYIPKFRKK